MKLTKDDGCQWLGRGEQAIAPKGRCLKGKRTSLLRIALVYEGEFEAYLRLGSMACYKTRSALRSLLASQSHFCIL